MDPEITQQPVADQQQTNTPPPLNNSLDAELDAALGRHFPNQAPKQDETIQETTPKQEAAKPEPKAVDQKQSESKEQSKKADKPVEAEKPLLTPDEIDKTDQKEKGAWGALKKNNHRSLEIIKQREQEIEKLKAVVAEKGQMSQKELDALKAENGELAKYRAMIDIQADPEFLSKFDQPIEKSISSLKDMLTSFGVSDQVVSQVDFTNTKLMDEIIGHVSEHRDKFAARKLERKVEELVALAEKRDETLAEQKTKYKETLEAKKKETFTKQTEQEGRVLKHLESVIARKDDKQQPVLPFLNKMEPKDGATQPEIDQINSHNKMVDAMQGKLKEALDMKEPEQKAEVAIAAVMSHYLSAQLRHANAQIQSLQSELQKVSAVSTETEKNKSQNPTRKANGHIMDLDDALATHFSGRS